LSHVSGALEYDVPDWGLDLGDVHLTRLDGRSGRREAGIQPHRGEVVPGDIVLRNGILVSSPTRLVLEATTILDVEHSLVVANHFLRARLTSRSSLAERYELMKQWPHTLATDLVLRLADPRPESVGEVRTAYLCFAQSLPAPIPQFEIFDATGRLVARADFAWPGLGAFLEFDGKVKYERYLREGERASDAVLREKRREELICRLTGWRCIRITWADLERPARTAAIIRAVLFPGSAAA
jgi:hypothetical protein